MPRLNQTESLGKNQIVRPAEMLGRQLDFYILRTTLPLTPGVYDAESQVRLNAVIQLVGLRCTPCIINVEQVFQETDPVDLNVQGTVDVHTLRFAIDAVGAWEGATPSLAQMISELGHGFTVDNFSLTYQSSL